MQRVSLSAVDATADLQRINRKKSKSKADREQVKDSVKADLLKKQLDQKDAPSPSGSPGQSSSSTGYQTDAQRRFEETQRKRVSSLCDHMNAHLLATELHSLR